VSDSIGLLSPSSPSSSSSRMTVSGSPSPAARTSRIYPGCTHSSLKRSPADLTVATFEFLKLQGGVPDPETKREICQRNSPGVDQGPPRRRRGPTRRLLSALRGVLLPFAHGFRRLASSGSDGVCWKVGRPRALVACWDSTNRWDNICPFIGLGSKRFAEVPRASPLSSFQPLRAGRACHSHAFAY
jgi:hypothetical protein